MEVFMKKLIQLLLCFFLSINIGTNVWASVGNEYIIDLTNGNSNTGKIKTYEELFNFKISVGNENAPVKIIKYMSLQCSYCKDTFLEAYEYFLENSTKGDFYIELKFLDYPRFVFDDYIFGRYDNIERFDSIYNIYNTYDTWINFESFEELDAFFELGDIKLERVIHQKISMAEFKAKNLKGVPTTIINGDIIENVDTLDEFKEIVESYIELTE